MDLTDSEDNQDLDSEELKVSPLTHGSGVGVCSSAPRRRARTAARTHRHAPEVYDDPEL